jgi:hypothetical protein
MALGFLAMTVRKARADASGVLRPPSQCFTASRLQQAERYAPFVLLATMLSREFVNAPVCRLAQVALFAEAYKGLPRKAELRHAVLHPPVAPFLLQEINSYPGATCFASGTPRDRGLDSGFPPSAACSSGCGTQPCRPGARPGNPADDRPLPVHALFNRQVAMCLAKHVAGWSTTCIGRFYNGRDHSTVIHGIQ